MWMALVMLGWYLIWGYIIKHTKGFGIDLPPILSSLRSRRGETRLLSDPTLITYDSNSSTCLRECQETQHCKGVHMYPDGKCKIFAEPHKRDNKNKVTYYDKYNRSVKRSYGVPLTDNLCKGDGDCIEGTACINGSCIPSNLNACKTWCDSERRCIGINYIVSDNTSISDALDTKCIPYMEYIPDGEVEIINESS